MLCLQAFSTSFARCFVNDYPETVWCFVVCRWSKWLICRHILISFVSSWAFPIDKTRRGRFEKKARTWASHCLLQRTSRPSFLTWMVLLPTLIHFTSGPSRRSFSRFTCFPAQCSTLTSPLLKWEGLIIRTISYFHERTLFLKGLNYFFLTSSSALTSFY